MTLRIKCPACERKFQVSEELKGRTVECGGCEHRFQVDEQVLEEHHGKFYPGEKKKPGLDTFRRSQKLGTLPVEFETAAYNQTQSVADFVPISPQQMVATTLGVGMLALTIVLMVLGTQPEGIFRDMEVAKRVVLTLFMVAIGATLVLYGCVHRRRTGYLVAGVGVGVALALSFLMPVPRTIEKGSYSGERTGPKESGEDPRPVPRPLTALEVREQVGYGPVQRAIAGHTTADVDGAQFVCALWVPVMEERVKFQIMKYLHRKTGTVERPSFYRRGDGGLFVIDGTQMPIEQVAVLVERFGRVEEIYPEIRIITVTVESGRLIEASKVLMEKLTDKTHSAFYARNLKELDHIDLDRVDGAVKRLAGAEPKRFRVEISRRLIELMDEETDGPFKGEVCRALAVWSKPGDGADPVVAATARKILEAGETMPHGMLEFLASRKSAEAVPIIEALWIEDPSSWEPVIAEIGSVAEDTVIKHIHDERRGVQQSAVRILKRMGSQRSVEPLRALHDSTDDEMKILIQEAIESIEGGE